MDNVHYQCFSFFIFHFSFIISTVFQVLVVFLDYKLCCNVSSDLVVHVKNKAVATEFKLAHIGEFLASLDIWVTLAELFMQLLNVPESSDERLKVTMADVELDKADTIGWGCCCRHQLAGLWQPAELKECNSHSIIFGNEA